MIGYFLPHWILLQHGTELALAFRLIGIITCVGFVIPLLLRGARINNGLRVFRWLLLIYGAIDLYKNFETFFYLINLFSLHVPQRVPNAILQVNNGFWTMMESFIVYMMFHYKFSEESMAKHTRIENLEKRMKKKYRKLDK